MSFRVDESWISGAFLVGDDGLGVLGSEIPSTGDNGAGYAYNDLSLPADANKEICGRITSWPQFGTLYAYEDTSLIYTRTAAGDGVDVAEYQLYVDGVATGTPKTITFTVGSANVSIAGAWTEANDTAASTGALTVSGSSATTEANDTTAAAGTVTSNNVTGTAGWTEANDTVSAAGTSGAITFARAPRGSGYRRPFQNTVRLSSPNTKRTKH